MLTSHIEMDHVINSNMEMCHGEIFRLYASEENVVMMDIAY
jgi:hypothetical protein